VTLRDWAVAAWARPGVAEACLDLQDRHGQCVALLLWRLWAGAMPEAVLIQVIEAARPFEHEVLRPLRAARRAVGEGDLKPRIRAAELAAEYELLAALEAFTPLGDAGSPLDAETALAAVLRAWNGVGAEAAGPAARLAAALRLC
jgi:uncharacterized protein (TIGR02444 family)